MWAWAGGIGKREIHSWRRRGSALIGDPAVLVVAHAAREMSGCGRPVMTNLISFSSADLRAANFHFSTERVSRASERNISSREDWKSAS